MGTIARLRQLIAYWLDPTPERVDRELYELLLKAARRCNHDLAHAADDIMMSVRDRKEAAEMWNERANMWHGIFYPDNGPKDYRSSMHREIWQLESTVKRLYAVLDEHGIADPKDDRIPF